MKLLITAFEPFGGELTNPSMGILEQLPDQIDGLEIIKLVLPVTFSGSSSLLCQAIDQAQPDFVLSLGQAGGRTGLSVEVIGINLDEAAIPDNNGDQPQGQRISEHQADGYFSTLPTKAMVQAAINGAIPAYLSYTAGTYVCNHVLYSSLAHIQKNNYNMKAGFVHIPYLPEQTITKTQMASMALSDMVKGIHLMISSLQSDETLELSQFGTTH